MKMKVGVCFFLAAILLCCAGCGVPRPQQTEAALLPDEFAPFFEGGDLPILNLTPGSSYDFYSLEEDGMPIVTKRGVGIGSSAQQVAEAYGDVAATMQVQAGDPRDKIMTLEAYLQNRDGYQTEEVAAAVCDYIAVYEMVEYRGENYTTTDWIGFLEQEQLAVEHLNGAAKDGALSYYYMAVLFTNDEVINIDLYSE